MINREILSEYYNLDEKINLKALSDTKIRQILNQEENDYLTNTVGLLKITEVFHSVQQKDTKKFLESKYEINDVGIELNWPNFGLEEYIILLKIRKEVFYHKSQSQPISTREFLCVPGLKEIYTTTNTGFFQTNFLHFIFPFHSPPYNVFHSLLRWNYLSDLIILRVKTKHVWFNASLLWDNTTKFGTWDLIANNLITGNLPEIEDQPISLHYQKNQKTIPPTSYDYNLIKSIYDQNIKKFKNLPVFTKIVRLHRKNMIWFLPKLDKIHPFPHRIIILLYPMDAKQKSIFISLFMTLPFSITYEVDYLINGKSYEGLYVDLRFHHCYLSEFLHSLQKIIQYFHIPQFRIIPSIISISKNEYTCTPMKNYPNLFDSHIWDNYQYKNVRFFHQNGPLSIDKRYTQLRIRR